mmetsp:Transcript_5468/g.12879  ORF Transcript_5468/g.12879 Transcript_5468/m.12879 type:complete len:558 (+) Transcript_5468:250-1923(+)
MKDCNTNQQQEQSEELPFDVEWQSFPSHSAFQFTSESRPASPTITPVVSRPPITQEDTTCNVTDSSHLPSKPPKTSDTSFSREDEEVKGDVDASMHDKEEAGDTSSCSSHTIVQENASTNKLFSLTTKSVLIAVLLIVTLIITILVAVHSVLLGQRSEDSVPATEFTDWSTVRPTVSAPIETVSPSSFPTTSPTLAPTTLSPTKTFDDIITDFLFQENSNVSSADDPAVQKAVTWLVDEANAAQSILFPLDQKYLQRFGLLILYFSVDPNDTDNIIQPSNNSRLPNQEMRNQDECSWPGMTCDANGMLTAVKLSNRQLDGTLPVECWGFLSNLKSIDFSRNELSGSIPEGVYDISRLEEIFLYKNRLTGVISPKIGYLWSLRRFHLSHNQISGPIPGELASSESRIRQLRYFNVHRNQMTGTIPANMRLRQLFSMDLGYNQFDGTLPSFSEAVRLRHLYLDHNRFSGTFPSSVLNAGDGRLNTLFINDNEFAGTFPGDHQQLNYMVELTIENNNFVSMEKNSTCQLDVFSGGELVEFKSDCLVCRCGVDFMCRHCQL